MMKIILVVIAIFVTMAATNSEEDCGGRKQTPEKKRIETQETKVEAQIEQEDWQERENGNVKNIIRVMDKIC